MDWKEQASFLYYENKMDIHDIADQLKKNYNRVRSSIKNRDIKRYEKEKERRKLVTKEKEKKKKLEYYHQNSNSENDELYKAVQRQHHIDVGELSESSRGSTIDLIEKNYIRSGYTMTKRGYVRKETISDGCLVPTTLPKRVNSNQSYVENRVKQEVYKLDAME